MLPLRQIKPKNARTKRYVENKAPQISENPKETLFLRYTTCSEILHLVLKDLYALKRPLATKFSKKNSIHPFEDPSSLEFFAEKNDTSLMVYGSHSKKRPHCLTLIRLFDYKILDMIELLLDPESMRTLSQFKATKPAVGLKPMLSFSGSAFESPTANEYTLAKSILTDLFKGPDVPNVDVEGLQHMLHFTVDEPKSDEVKPMIRIRSYMLKTRKAGGNLPKVEVEEIGPRLDFRIGRIREADQDMWKEAMRKPKVQEPKTKKNIDTDIVGDKVGRIHMGRQDLSQLQSRKMKGLKRERGRNKDDDGDVDMDRDEVFDGDSDDGGVTVEPQGKRAKVGP